MFSFPKHDLNPSPEGNFLTDTWSGVTALCMRTVNQKARSPPRDISLTQAAGQHWCKPCGAPDELRRLGQWPALPSSWRLSGSSRLLIGPLASDGSYSHFFKHISDRCIFLPLTISFRGHMWQCPGTSFRQGDLLRSAGVWCSGPVLPLLGPVTLGRSSQCSCLCVKRC